MSSALALSAASIRSGTLTPPSTATNGTNITRADFQRWAHEDRNHAQADMTRTEREERRRFKQEQKELFRSRGVALKEAQKKQMEKTLETVNSHRAENKNTASQIRDDEKKMSERKKEQQLKWANHGYELTQQYTIKAAQSNMRSLKAQNAGIVTGMNAKKADRQHVRSAAFTHRTAPSPRHTIAHACYACLLCLCLQVVEAQRSAAQEERRQRVERIKSETTDTVTRNAKKGYVDERWDVADTMREQMETWRAQRKAQELAYLESALAINAATSMEPAREAKEKARATKLAATAQLRERKKIIKEQQATDGSSITQAKSAIHDSIHGLKFVPDEEVRTHSSTGRWNTRTYLPSFFSRIPSFWRADQAARKAGLEPLQDLLCAAHALELAPQGPLRGIGLMRR